MKTEKVAPRGPMVILEEYDPLRANLSEVSDDRLMYLQQMATQCARCCQSDQDRMIDYLLRLGDIETEIVARELDPNDFILQCVARRSIFDYYNIRLASKRRNHSHDGNG